MPLSLSMCPDAQVDMERVNKKIELAIASGHAGVPPYNASLHESPLDYLSEVISKAKLAPYRDELLELLVAWQQVQTRGTQRARGSPVAAPHMNGTGWTGLGGPLLTPPDCNDPPQGEIRLSAPLRRIEELIDEEVLDPDVLVIRGDYEHYRCAHRCHRRCVARALCAGADGWVGLRLEREGVYTSWGARSARD